MAESQANDNNTCVVCFKNVLYYSIGECDHPVCFECSTRMRVLCLQNECPICRQDLSRVVFTDTVQTYKELCKKVFADRLFERQFKIGFCSEDIKHAYEHLLENRCCLCDKIPFRTFTILTDHMRKVHERYYCDLCVKHLKIFTNERKCYTRQELAHHRRKGDLDDTSHRGHPLCEFCEERFMDADELYRHLRKEHLYCHLCDADGRNLYYASHSALAHHFRTEHYLCEDGECAGQHLTAVFRSEIDLKAHKATVHGRGMPRGAARQARTLELQFNITPHPVVQRASRTVEQERESEHTETIFAGAAGRPLDPQSDEQFPRLSAAPPVPAPLLPTPSSRSYRGSDGLTRNDRNFPALDGAGPSRPPPARPAAATVLRSSSSKPGLSIQVHSQPASASNFRLTQTSSNRITHMPQKKNVLSDDDFPSLGIAKDDHPSLGAGTVQPAKVTLINSEELKVLKNNQQNQNHQPRKAPLSAEAFPALSSAAAPTAPPQWITVSKSKEKPKAKPEAPPTPKAKAKSFNPIADFPTLPVNTAAPISVNNKAKAKKTQPQPQPPPTNVQAENNKNKKEKKKPNSKKENYVDLSLPDEIGDYKKSKDYIAACVNNNNSSVEADKKIKTVTETQSGTQKTNTDFKLAQKEFPSLSAKVDNVPRPVQNGSVPPGFKKRPPCNGMTFTNSSGQTFSAPVHAFIPPPDFEERNRALVKKFVAALGSAEAVEEFKVASRAFRDSILSAEDFYRHCKSAMGSELDAVFPDLVALLPDIAKQQELVVGRDIGTKLDMCATCGQLLSPSDRVSHNSAHWPPLAAR